MTKQKLVPFFALIFLVLLLGLYFRYPTHSAYSVRGLDISHHQGKIEWELIPHDFVDFVYIKATEGGDFSDREFSRNWVSAQKVGIKRGAYHFFTFCTPGELQAQHFIATVGDSFGEIPPAIDIEYGGNCKKRLSDTELTQELAAFNAELKKAWGVEPLYYVTRDIYNDFPQAFKGKRIWGRAIMTPPWREYGAFWDVWQFSSFGHVPGIKGPVDQNVFRGSLQEFKQWIEDHQE